MNVERMLYLADQLDRPTDPKLKLVHFDMSDFSTKTDEVGKALNCGTTACIGGHACLLFGDPHSVIGETEAQKLLGLTTSQANTLFYNTDDYIIHQTWTRPFGSITPAEAAAAIRKMVEEES